MIMVADVRTRCMRARVRTRALFARGGRAIIEESTGSTPNDCAGGPSIRISIEGRLVLRSNGLTRALTDPKDLHCIKWIFETKERT